MPETETAPTLDVWANIKALTGVKEVNKLMNAPQDWLTSQPVIQGLLNHPDAKMILSWLEAKDNIAMFPALISQCGLAFFETSHGINRAYNSKAHANLAGAGEAALSTVISTSTEKGIYGDAVNAFNDSLNLPELVKTGIRINQDLAETWAAIEKKRLEMIKEAEELRSTLFKQLESSEVKLAERKKLRTQYDKVAKSLVGMGQKAIAPPRKKPKSSTTPTPTPTPTPAPTGGGSGDKAPNHVFSPGFGLVIGHNPYEINSIYNARISSIRSIKVNASALVIVPVVAPIVAVSGAIATVGITAGIISTIASWFLGSAMNLVGMPAALIPALTHCVTSIVLKVSGSAGAEALRFFSASVLKANANLLTNMFGTTNMGVTSWMFLTAMALPILLVSIIIILAMKNKVLLSEMLYIFADIQDKPGRFNVSLAHMYDTNPQEILEQFKTSAKRLIANTPASIERITGVGLTNKKEYAICYNLTNPDNPIPIIGNEAILAAIGADKIAKIASGQFVFDWS